MRQNLSHETLDEFIELIYENGKLTPEATEAFAAFAHNYKTDEAINWFVNTMKMAGEIAITKAGDKEI